MADRKDKTVKNLELRNQIWHLRMRVPRRYAAVEKRTLIRRTLRTDSLEEAKERVGEVRRATLVELNARLAGYGIGSEASFEALSELAMARGLPYQTSSELAAGSLDDILRRLERLRAEDPGAERSGEIASDLGGAKRPVVMVSVLVSEYEHVSRARLAKKNEDEKRRWRNPYKRAVREFMEVVPDKPAHRITRQDALLMEGAYIDRVEEDEILAATANKGLGFMRTLLRAHCKRHQLDDNHAFAGLTINGGRDSGKRRELSDEWILDILLGANPLSGTNDEIRDVLIIMSLTGGSPSEITGTLPHHFSLDEEVPHLQLRNEGRSLKNEFRVRDLVLAGAALEAARRHPNGFERYRFKPRFSDAANGYLRDNGLLPTPEHTVYSLRHSFQGRMRRAKLDEYTQARMMGHSAREVLQREIYGDDLTLEERLEATLAVMLPSPVA